MGTTSSFEEYPEEQQPVLIDFQQWDEFNCVKDEPDARDVIIKGAGDVRHRVFTVNGCSEIPVVSDETLGLSIISSICYAIYYNELKASQSNSAETNPVQRSRLFAFYNERTEQGKFFENINISVRNCIKNINKYGLCPEPLWACNPKKVGDRPPIACFELAKNNKPL